MAGDDEHTRCLPARRHAAQHAPAARAHTHRLPNAAELLARDGTREARSSSACSKLLIDGLAPRASALDVFYLSPCRLPVITSALCSLCRGLKDPFVGRNSLQAPLSRLRLHRRRAGGTLRRRPPSREHGARRVAARLAGLSHAQLVEIAAAGCEASTQVKNRADAILRSRSWQWAVGAARRPGAAPAGAAAAEGRSGGRGMLAMGGGLEATSEADAT